MADEDEFGAPPPAGAAASTSTYIGGVPGDSRVPELIPGDPGPWGKKWWRKPTRGESPTLDEMRASKTGGYVTGDEWLPVNESPATIEDLQRRLYEAGLLPADAEFTPGYFDEPTRKAFKDLLGWSNGKRKDWLTTLEDLRTNPVPSDEKGAAIQPFVAQVSNPDDIKKNIRDSFREMIGSGDVDANELQALVAEFQGEQVASQRSMYDAYQDGSGGVGPGGTVTAPPSIETFVEQKAQQSNPTAFSAYKYLDKFSAISDMLGGASVNS